MPTQEIGKIRVVVNNQELGPINVRQSGQVDKKVGTLSYGQPLELKRAVDLDIGVANTGEGIIYNSATNSFEVAPITANTSNFANTSNSSNFANTSIFANTANTVLIVQGGTF